jgi:hypothetical protein
MVDHLDDRRFSSQTIKAIRIIVGKKGLVQPFRASDVNVALGIDWAGHFLPKHCDKRPDKKMTRLFDRVGRGLYRLTTEQQALCDAGLSK